MELEKAGSCGVTRGSFPAPFCGRRFGLGQEDLFVPFEVAMRFSVFSGPSGRLLALAHSLADLKQSGYALKLALVWESHL